MVIFASVIIFLMSLLVILFFYNRYMFSKANRLQPKGEFVEAGGLKLHYITKGEGKPVVFLHGGILTSEDFGKVMDMAVSKGFKTISFDRPGYGFSERFRDRKISPEDQAVLIHKALAKLGVERPIIVGHSWSGATILAYALMYPDDISSVITISAAMYKEGYPAANGDALSRLVTTPFIGRVILNILLFPLGKLMAESSLKYTFSPDPIPKHYREDTFLYWLRPGQFRANREDILGFATTVQELSTRYKNIRIPVLIVVGDKDPFGTIEHAHRLNKELPDSRLVVIPDAGHMLPQCYPEKIAEIISQCSPA